MYNNKMLSRVQLYTASDIKSCTAGANMDIKFLHFVFDLNTFDKNLTKNGYRTKKFTVRHKK